MDPTNISIEEECEADGTFDRIPTTYYVLLSLVTLALGLSSLIFNSITFRYYKSKSKDTIPLMYMALSSCDFVSGISALLNSATLIALIFKNDYSKVILIPMSAFSTSVTSHTSVFYNMNLVVIRTINLLFPTYRLQNRILQAIFLIYPILVMPFTVYDIYGHLDECGDCRYVSPICEESLEEALFLDYIPLSGHFTVEMVMTLCGLSEDAFMEVEGEDQGSLSYTDMKDKLNAIFCIIIPYVVPALISLFCFFMQASVLLHKKSDKNNEYRRITVTILYLTILFFICNVTSLVTFSLFEFFGLQTKRQKETGIRENYQMITVYVTGVVLSFVNSAINPIILIYRGKELKKFVRKQTRRVTIKTVFSNAIVDDQ